MNTLSNIIPNPLLLNKTLNSNYAINRFATSDFNGKNNSAVIRKYTDNIIANRLPDKMYIGGIGELGLIMENISYINNIIKEYNGDEICLNAKYASSTFYNEKNIISKEYNVGTTVDTIWYYNTYNGMISKDKITNTFRSLPIYKFDIADFDSTEDDYDDVEVNIMKIIEHEDLFDLTSYMFYCQDDSLDNITNTLTYYFYKQSQNSVNSLSNYGLIDNNNAFATDLEKYRSIAPNSFNYHITISNKPQQNSTFIDEDTALVVEKNYNYLNNIDKLYVRTLNDAENNYYDIKILNNKYSINKTLYIDYQYEENETLINNGENDGTNMPLNIEISKSPKIISRVNISRIYDKTQYTSDIYDKPIDNILICEDDNILSTNEVLFANASNEKIERITITSINELLLDGSGNRKILPFKIKYKYNDTYYNFDKTIKINYSFSKYGVVSVNTNSTNVDELNQLIYISDGTTTITASSEGGTININGENVIIQPFTINCGDIDISIYNVNISHYFSKKTSGGFVSESSTKLSIYDYRTGFDNVNNSNTSFYRTNIDQYAITIKNNDSNKKIPSLCKTVDFEISTDNENEIHIISDKTIVHEYYFISEYYTENTKTITKITDIYKLSKGHTDKYYRYESVNNGLSTLQNKHNIINNLIKDFLEISAIKDNNTLKNKISFNDIIIDNISNLLTVSLYFNLNYTDSNYKYYTNEYDNNSFNLSSKYLYSKTNPEIYDPYTTYKTIEIIKGGELDIHFSYNGRNIDNQNNDSNSSNTITISNINELPTLYISDPNYEKLIKYEISKSFESNLKYAEIDPLSDKKIIIYKNTPKKNSAYLVVKAIFDDPEDNPTINVTYKPKIVTYKLKIESNAYSEGNEILDAGLLKLGIKDTNNNYSNTNVFEINYTENDLNKDYIIVDLNNIDFINKTQFAAKNIDEYDCEFYITLDGIDLLGMNTLIYYILSPNNEHIVHKNAIDSYSNDTTNLNKYNYNYGDKIYNNDEIYAELIYPSDDNNNKYQIKIYKVFLNYFESFEISSNVIYKSIRLITKFYGTSTIHNRLSIIDDTSNSTYNESLLLHFSKTELVQQSKSPSKYNNDFVEMSYGDSNNTDFTIKASITNNSGKDIEVVNIKCILKGDDNYQYYGPSAKADISPVTIKDGENTTISFIIGSDNANLIGTTFYDPANLNDIEYERNIYLYGKRSDAPDKDSHHHSGNLILENLSASTIFNTTNILQLNVIAANLENSSSSEDSGEDSGNETGEETTISDNSITKKAKVEYIGYDFCYYIYFTANQKNYLIYSNNPKFKNDIANDIRNNISQEHTLTTYTNNNGNITQITFYYYSDYYLSNLELEYNDNQHNELSLYKLFKSAQIKNTLTTYKVNVNNLLQYPIYKNYIEKPTPANTQTVENIDNILYSIPLLPSRKVDNYYDCEFFIIIPEFSINNNQNNVQNEYTTDRIFNNVRINIKFGDGDIKEVLTPYKKFNDVVLYKFRRFDLFDYTYIQNQEILITIVDNSYSNNDNNGLSKKILYSKKFFFNIFKFNLKQSKYQNIDFQIKYNNYYPLKYPLPVTKKRYLELNYVPLDKIDITNTNKLALKQTVEFDESAQLYDINVNLEDLGFNYSYLNSYTFHNVSETNDMLSWFLKENGNGLNTCKMNIDNNTNLTYPILSLTFNDLVDSNYKISNIFYENNIYCKNLLYYDKFGILSGTHEDECIKTVDKSINNSEVHINMNVFGMKEILYVVISNTLISNQYRNLTQFDFIETNDLIHKYSIFEDYLYIYNNCNDEVSIYFTDESKTLCESTRKITLAANEIRLYKPSRHTDYYIIIKNHSIDNYILKYYNIKIADFGNINNSINSATDNLTKTTNNKLLYNSLSDNFIDSEYEDMVQIKIYDFYKGNDIYYGHIVSINQKNNQ